MHTKEIRITALMRIKPDAHEGFTKVAQKLSEIAEGEPGTLVYQYYQSGARDQICLHEHYIDSNAMLGHFENIGDLGQQAMAYFDLEQLDLCGDISPELDEILAPFGDMKTVNGNSVLRRFTAL